MPILRQIRTVTISVLVALAAAGAGCDTLRQLQQYPAPAQEHPYMDTPSGAQLSAATSQISLPGKDPHAFTIGAVLPLSGSRAVAGQAMQHGLQLAVNEINTAGGINGQPIQLTIADSKSDQDTGSSALEKFHDYGEAVLLVGDGPLAVAKAEELAAYPTAIGFMSDYVAALKLTPKNGLRIYLNGDQEGRAIEGYIEAAGVDRVAVVHQNDLLGTSHSQYLLYLFSANHSIFTTEEGYSAGEKNFALLGQAMLRVNTGAIILAGNGPEYAKILAAFDAAGWKGLVFGYAGIGGLGTVAGQGRLGATAAYPLPDFAANPRSTDVGRAFADAYRAAFGSDPNLPAAYAYDNVRALAAAAKQSASNDPQKIRSAFISLGTYTGAVGRYDIKDDGDTEMPLRLLRADGQPLPPPATPAPVPSSSDITNVHAPTITQP